MEQSGLIALDYLDEMSEKVVEVLTPLITGSSYEISKEQPFPTELMKLSAQVVIDVAVANETGITAFHVVPLVEEHLYMLDVQDKSQQTVATVMFITSKAKSRITVEDIMVTFKKGAIIGRQEELLNESVVFEGEEQVMA